MLEPDGRSKNPPKLHKSLPSGFTLHSYFLRKMTSLILLDRSWLHFCLDGLKTTSPVFHSWSHCVKFIIGKSSLLCLEEWDNQWFMRGCWHVGGKSDFDSDSFLDKSIVHLYNTHKSHHKYIWSIVKIDGTKKQSSSKLMMSLYVTYVSYTSSTSTTSSPVDVQLDKVPRAM